MVIPKPKITNNLTIKLTHNFYNTSEGFSHSLTVCGVEGAKVGYRQIAVNGNFRAVTAYYTDTFPEVFLINDFTNICSTIKVDTVSKDYNPKI